ncbi:MAG: aldolase [Clostridia bacterium]|nr:aldolase [Clostridia bacterium]
MSLKLMYITNRPEVAKIAERSGIDRIFVDMEYIGKDERQKGLNSVKNRHTIQDIKNIKSALTTAELLVRVNPIHEKTSEYESSETEIEAAIATGGKILMLPMVKTAQEVERFIRTVDGRAKTMLLIETAEANENIHELLQVDGIDEVHIGLNDMHLAYKKKFMFELLTDGTVDRLCGIFKKKGIPYGFGGIARLGYGMLPAENVIVEHYRLGSTGAIVSRSFCDANTGLPLEEVERLFIPGMRGIRALERAVQSYTAEQFEENRKEVQRLVAKIVQP